MQPAAKRRPFLYNLRPKGATTTLGAQGPSNLRTLRPIGPVNPKNLFYKHDGRVPRHFRHLERSCMPLWETDRNRSHDTLSREISRRNVTRTTRGGDFSTPLRFGRNDERGAANIVISSGGFMRRLSRGVLFCPLHRGKSGTAGKGEANAVSQSQNAYHVI